MHNHELVGACIRGVLRVLVCTYAGMCEYRLSMRMMNCMHPCECVCVYGCVYGSSMSVMCCVPKYLHAFKCLCLKNL